MKSYLSIFLLIIFNSQLFSQDINKEFITGKWKVINCVISPEMEKGLNSEATKGIELIKKGFIGANFNFESNNKFTIKFKDNTSKYMKELQFLNNNLWIIDKEKNIKIGSKKDNYSLMMIKTKNINGKLFFILSETPILLEVVKQ